MSRTTSCLVECLCAYLPKLWHCVVIIIFSFDGELYCNTIIYSFTLFAFAACHRLPIYQHPSDWSSHWHAFYPKNMRIAFNVIHNHKGPWIS